MQRRVSRHFARLQAVRLGRFEDTRICGPCFEEGYAGGDNIREANLATGTETFQRHGKQIGQEPYPTDGTTVTGWWVRTPQIVIRRRTGEPQGDDTIGGSTTADQEIRGVLEHHPRAGRHRGGGGVGVHVGPEDPRLHAAAHLAADGGRAPASCTTWS